MQRAAVEMDASGGTAQMDGLYREMRSNLVWLATGLLDDAAIAEEIVQEAFLGLFRRWSQISNHEAAPSYLRRSVINAARSELRRRALTRRRVAPIDLTSNSAADSGALLNEEYSQVVRAVKALPRRQQEIVLLRYWQGLSVRETSEATGVSAGTVKSTCARALQKIRQELETQ